MINSTLTAGQIRTAVRASIRAHRDCDKAIADMFGTERGVSDLAKSELDDLARRLGLGGYEALARVAIAQTNTAPAASATRDFDSAPTGLEALQARADAAVTEQGPLIAELAHADVADVEAQTLTDGALAPLGALRGLVAPHIMGAVEASVLELARQSLKPAVEVVRTVTVDADGAPVAPVKPALPIPRVCNVQTANVVFGNAKSRQLAAVKVDVWNAPDAPQPDSLFRFEPEALTDLLTAIKRNRHVWLYGPKGTGKTSLAMQLAARTGRPFVRIAIDRTTEAADLIGGPGIRNGSTFWRNGVLTEAMERPGTVILIDEPSYGRPGALAVLQTVLDFGFVTLKEDGGRRVDAAPGVVFLASDNTNGTGDESGQYVDTGTMNAAFLDRFSKFVRVDYLPMKVEADVIASRTGCPLALATTLAGFAGISRKRAEGGDLTGGIGLRRLLALAEAVTDGIDPKRALDTTITGCAPPEDRAVLNELIAAHVSPGELVRLRDPNAVQSVPVSPAGTPEGQRAQRDFDNA